MNFKEIFEMRDKVLIIHVNGELDHHNSIFIRQNVDELIRSRNILEVIFDFSGTSFMDSSGIGVIMGRYKKVKPLGGMVYVMNTNKSVEKILLFSGLNKIVKHIENVEEISEKAGGNR